MRLAHERWLLAVALTVGLLLTAGPAGQNPDGLEMIALAKRWRGEGPAIAGGSYWPPLWPGLLSLIGGALPMAEAGRLLNLICAGAALWPIHLAAARLIGPWGARAAALIYALQPALRDHAAVLDARMLGLLLGAMALGLAVEADYRGRAGRSPYWVGALIAAGLAPLARPEGALLLPVVWAARATAIPGASLIGARQSAKRQAAWLAACGAAALPSLLRPGGGRGWEAFTGPWLGVWSNGDLLALFGPNTAPTPFRAFVLAAEAAGIEAAPSALPGVLRGLPAGLALIAEAGPALLGGAGLVAAGIGLLRLIGSGIAGLLSGRRGSIRPILAAAALVGMWLPLLTPMARDQATAVTNALWLLPAGTILAAACWPARRGPLARSDRADRGPGALLLAGLILAVAHLGPDRGRPPTFFEGTEAARVMTLWLSRNPPETKQVACRLSGRGVVLAAGLEPVALPSLWEGWSPPPGVGALISTVDLRGADGGRGLELLESPAWEVRAISASRQVMDWPSFLHTLQTGQSAPTPDGPGAPGMMRAAVPGISGHWMLYLERRPAL